MKMLIGALAVLAASPAVAQTQAPLDFIDALNKGFEIVAVTPQGDGGQDHVIYMRKDGRIILCGFRVVLTEHGLDPAKSKTLGQCTGFVGAK